MLAPVTDAHLAGGVELQIAKGFDRGPLPALPCHMLHLKHVVGKDRAKLEVLQRLIDGFVLCVGGQSGATQLLRFWRGKKSQVKPLGAACLL